MPASTHTYQIAAGLDWPGFASRCSHVCLIVITLLMVHLSQGQLARQFPPLFNAALGRPISTNPTGSTCGQTTRSAYCFSSVSVDSINRCIQGYCYQACPDRAGPPPDSSVFSMLTATSPGTGDCILSDTINVRPGTASGQYSTQIARAGPNCYLTPVNKPRLDASGVVAFTVSSWVWLDSPTKGTLLEKQADGGAVLFSFQVGASGFTIVYGSVGADPLSVSIDATIPTQTWRHVTLQVHDVQASVYINGPGSDLSAFATITLLSTVTDSEGVFRVGQSLNGNAQFLGRVQDLKFYSVTLTNREIAQVYSGVFPPVRIQSECRCPGTYPRVKPGQTKYCIRNGNLATSSDMTPRISGDAHPLEYTNDGDSNSMWISGFQNEVDIEIDLGDQYQVFYVVLQFYSSFPKAVTFLRQKNDSAPFEVWQYYADDCTRFGLDNNGAYPAPDSVNCLQFGTNGAPIPYSLGNITFNLLAPDPVARPGSNDFYNTPELHEFVRARRVRVRFDDHYYVTSIRHQYFALYEFIVTAWCECNGHATQCLTNSLPYTCNCTNSSNTEGPRCERCKPLFNNKPYKKGDNLRDNPCQECTCYDHALSCVYNATLDPSPDSLDQGGGGVCVNCQHFTTGRFCDSCLPNYFRTSGVSLYDPAVCQPCNCSPSGVTDLAADCSKVGGQCSCKANVEGRKCDTCKAGYYGLSATNPDGCQLCHCNTLGTDGASVSCDQNTGQCRCKTNVQGLHCDECKYGTYGLAGDNPLGCTECGCSPVGSSSVYCNRTSGQCQCKDRVTGLKCDTCLGGFYNFTGNCMPCSCNPLGVENGTVCDKTSGQCTCKQNVQGVNCDQCKEGTYNFGSSALQGCQSCPCVQAGTVNGTGSCDKTTGACLCKVNVEGQGCNKCTPNTWALNATDPLGCQPCDCDPLGTLLENRTVCDQNTGQCSCLFSRMGRRCESCSNGTYVNPTGGCQPCSCNPQGTLPGTSCHPVSGQCQCRQGDFGVAGKNCDQCMPTFYGFSSRLGFCLACNCLEAGSVNTSCHPVTGQCPCKTLVTNRTCDRCLPGSSHLDANNPLGCSSAPSQQPPPELSNSTSTSISFVWGPPDSPNGLILSYNIYRNSTLIGNTSATVTSYQDIELQPFTYYSYEVETQNAYGSVRSPAVTFQTLAGTPSDDTVLNVSDIRARSAFCQWSAPSNMNGPLLKYVIQSVNASSNLTGPLWEGTALNATLTGLSPYTHYLLVVQACTVGGCAHGDGVEITTLSAPPENQPPPVVTALSSSELMVTWGPPARPNGIISFYELWFRGPQGADGQYNPPTARIFNPAGRYDPLTSAEGSPLSAPATSYNVTGLQPFTTYEFQVLCENDAGKAASDWVPGTTLEAYPVSIASPSVVGISSSELMVSWQTPAPAEMQGLVHVYRLFQNIPQNLTQDPFGPPDTWALVYEGDGAVLNTTVPGLTPYSEHSFVLQACNSQGCVNSTAVVGRTLIAAPEGVQKPTAIGYNTTTMEIQWSQPLFPNGPPPLYKLQKTNIALSSSASVVRGTRFTGGSHYAFPPTILPQNVAFTGIRFRFRLERGTGLMLFSGTNTHEEFIAIQFVNGRPRFMFDTQGCPNVGFVTTTNDEGLVYNDKKWHVFEARRNGGYGVVTVDDKWKGESSVRDPSCLNTSIIGPTTAVYVGGFPPDFLVRRYEKQKKVETTPLQGCIDGFEILQQVNPVEVWKPINWTQGLTNDLEFLNWQGCPINLETGFHFMGKGYLILSNCEENICFVSGNTIRIQFRLRTELHTGLLFLLYGGTNIFMYSVLSNGTLKFVISNNAVRTEVTYNDPSETFCDGNWRLVTMTKTGQQASISVTSRSTFSLGDPNVDMTLALVSDIILGGLKAGSDAMKYVQANNLSIPLEGFGGCFSGFQINEKEYDRDMVVVDVANTNLDGCPPFYESKATCQSSLIAQVYQGMDRVAYDYGLLPFTDNIYRVIASNDAGDSSSSWAYGRTLEGAPSGVRGPTSVRAISGSEIEVVWGEPEATYGLLTKYVVMAYDNGSAVSLDVTDVAVTAVNMTGVTPDTQYLVKIVACTPGGCTESQDGMNVSTPMEAPEDVPPPTAQAGPTYLLVEWQAPGKPNGPISGYFLYQDGKEVYSGGQQSFNVTGLQVYTAYNFYLSACTSAGCTDGPTVGLSTSQLPPSSVGQPTLQVLDTSRIKVTWMAPPSVNGVLESYLLYVSTVPGQLGPAAYNSTDLKPETELTGLIAGTTYYVTLGACTGGGCTLGMAANATTEESAPSGVPAPRVTSPSPSSLVVTWDAPAQSNGVISRYELYQNDVLVYSGLAQSYSVGNLQPYSRHVLQLRACTAQGCAYGDQVVARTLESAPQGLIVVNATVIDARTVNVTWTQPEQMNGNMTFQVYFTGLFYADPAAWNYTTSSERRALLSSYVGYTVYQIKPLVPWSSYSVQVNGSNTVGYILSNVVGVGMPPGTPDGMAPPDLVSESPTSIKVTWKPVGRVNANESVAYLLQFMEATPDAIIRDEFGPTVTLTYTKAQLLPFTEYRFRVVASNSFGATQSPWASLVTRQDKPASMNAPLVVGVKARYVDITWSAPLSPNGVISQYKIYVNDSLRSSVASNITSLRVDSLAPFTSYTFSLEVCTVGGCTRSLPSAPVRTLEDIPENLVAPTLTPMSPSAVKITYQEPGKPNGIISQYIIERKLATSDNVSIVTTRVPEMEKTYIDESSLLTPFSVYSYRVSVANGAGVARGSFVQITTGSSLPAGVNPPQITSISPTSVLVKWTAPIQPNGQIETYVVHFPDPRIEVRNTAVLALVVTDLKPFTQYAVSVTACTSAGCTESAPTNFTTDPSIPSGQAAPAPTAISQSRISILWQPPLLPNGPNISYELSRMKVSQPLDTTAGDIGMWQSVYTGVDLFYEDTNLPMFTTYVYRVTVFNRIGQTVSPNSTLVTTFGGLPRLPANVTAVPVDHLTIHVNWSLPGPVELQGQVQNLTLQAASNISTTTVFPNTSDDSSVVTGLQPNTQYSVTLTVTIYGGASITSQPVSVKTKDGAPVGLNPPRLSVVSQTALRVSWTAPSQPNGEIVSYNILVNERRIQTGSRLPGSAIVDSLQPYTVYDIRIEACTVYACTTSNSALGTTAEALPQGMAAPVVSAVNATQVNVTWSPPQTPNGIIQRYELWRRSLKDCALLPAPTVSAEMEKCTYVECGVFESLCGTTCYSGAKVCCNGVVHEALPNYACCGSEYVLQQSTTDVCCGGQFHAPQTNYTCCGHRYVEVLPGEICCPDSSEDRVSVSQGDACCGSVPFMSSGAQLCCQGSLSNKLGNRCCGGTVISETTTCCGGADLGQVYLQQPGYTCCGQDYVQASLILCCSIDTAHSRVHLYGSEQEKLAASDKCCGLSRVTSNLACCNYVGYNPLSQVCADRSRQDNGCGTGVVCPISQQSTAYCNRCDFDTRQQTCGSVKGYQGGPPPTIDPTSPCTTETVRVYSGLNLAFTDSTLSAYSLYEYSVVAVNSAGTSASNYTSVRTLEAVPAVVHPPTTRIAPGQLYAIYLSWLPPEKPNGVITGYSLKRDGVEVYQGLESNFTDNFNILPYQSYSYSLSACNSAGCANSSLVTVATAQATPEDLQPPLVEVVNSTTLQFTAQPPGRPNGVILQYSVVLVDTGEVFNSTLPQQFIVTGLIPYTSYTLEMVVCTVVGCATSPNITVTTLEDLPQGLAPPRVIVINATSVELYWRAPDVVNGVITSFTLIQTQPAPVTTVYNGLATTLKLTSLRPGQAYTYQLQATNGAGSVLSIPREIILPSVAPLSVPPPQSVRVLSSTSIRVQWLPLHSDQANIDQYRVLLNVGQDTEVERGVGLQTNVTVPDLLPYTRYEVRLQACLRNVLNGCGTSSAVLVTTDEDKPLGLMPPKLTAVASTAVHIAWQPPTQPNGVITGYRVYQNQPNLANSEIIINQVSGSVFEFLHSGQDLKPFQVYEYRVVAANSKGEITSNYSSVRTLESVPAGFSAPVVSNISTYGVSLAWNPPVNPNGIIQVYTILYQVDSASAPEAQQSVSVAGNTTRTSLSGLEAYTTYTLSMKAANSVGNVSSPNVIFTTREGYPSGLSDFTVEKVSTGTSVILYWDAPKKPNGVITTYRVYQSEYNVAIYSGTARNFEFRRLSPYTKYLVKLEACTRVGCTLTREQSFYTAEIVPASQPSPTVGAVNATHVQLTWQPPLNPNGVITTYEVRRASRALRRRRDVSSAEEYMSLGELQMLSQSSLNVTDSPRLQQLDGQCLQPDRSVSSHEDPLDFINVVIDSADEVIFTREKRQASNASNVQTVYQTTDTAHSSFEFTDSNLRPYTEYQYSIRASNSLGYTDSPWQTVVTDQAAPDGVQPPLLSLVPNDIHSINVSWSAPAQINGLLQGYQLQRNTTVPYSFPANSSNNFVDSGLVAYTVYSYRLTACTSGGCTTSQPASMRTLEAAPLAVAPPVVTVVNSTALRVSWTEPQISNGIITRYSLKMDGQLIYTGLLQVVLLVKLVPYQAYVFSMTACTNGGCTESAEVTGRTEDAPPTDLAPPLLRVMSSTSIEISWSPPAHPNGVISSYDVRRGGTLIYTTSMSSGGTLLTSHIDYSLEPGIQYSYTVVARNRKGSIESEPAQAITYSASPTGLAAPRLTPLTSTSIQVDWSPPISPNGVLTNYSIYQGNNRTYFVRPSQLTYTVTGLQFYTQYTFSVEACTDRGCQVSPSAQVWTLPAQPEAQPAPSLIALADELGAHGGVRISWDPPAKPNGNITSYEVYRREGIASAADISSSPQEPSLVYNGSSSQYTDNSSQLQPDHQYQYKVVAVGTVGSAESPWASVRTQEAAPEGVLPPNVTSRTALTFTVTVTPPSKPNGVITLYQILVNGSVASSSPALQQTVGTSPLHQLSPYTTYELKTQACTRAGCTNSSGVMATTDSAKPGQATIQATAVTSSTVTLTWTAPASPNGKILRYEVYQRTSCPLTDQPFEQTCVYGDPRIIYTGLNLTYTARGLSPYTAYDFQLQVYNEKGGLDFPDWLTVNTSQSGPTYSRAPILYKNGTLAMISWDRSFNLNSRLKEYILLADGRLVFRGLASVFGVERQTKSQLINFTITAITDSGQAESPVIVFDPNAVDNTGTSTTAPSAVAASASPFYQEIWFIALMCILALIIMFLVLVVCVWRCGARRPYMRERVPLHQPAHNRITHRDLYVVDSRDGSVIHDNGFTTAKRRNKDNVYQGPGIGVINPAFSQDGELARISPTKIRWPTAKYLDDDDDDDLRWGKHFDSGLFDDLDDDSNSGQSYSYTKEQTVFTDTHL